MADYVSEILSRVQGLGGDSMYDVSGDDVVGALEQEIAGLVEVGALTEVGAKRMRQRTQSVRQRVAAPQMARPIGSGLPSPPFAQSGRDTERRAPLGFVEDGTGRNFFTLAAAIGAITTMRAKVSRVSHVDRLLIVPSAAGAVIESIKVGDEEQTLASGVPVELYGSSALTDTVPDNFSPIGPGLDFIITLRNTTASAITGTIGTKCACKR
jgi:hypothetical protein